ncbi:MAG: aminopeptidase [Betaproteobacteria bacterium]|nr:aminopeptidase [Betaproteobacteria bacterium]
MLRWPLRLSNDNNVGVVVIEREAQIVWKDLAKNLVRPSRVHGGGERPLPRPDAQGRRRPRPIPVVFPVVLLAALLGGCSTVGYYAQSVHGELQILDASRPIRQVIKDPHCTPALAHKLAEILAIRAYASQDLGLPDNACYRNYADLGRPYVTWNVFATPKLSLAPKTWCFPIAGCVAYRGYFSEREAGAEAARLRRKGYDVYVGGIPAYSTLGYFNDPVLNTFMGYPDWAVAELIFHELGHQVAYVPGETVFNESMANTIEREGMKRWLAADGTAAERREYEVARRRRQDFDDLVLKYQKRLAALYASPLPAERKLADKKAVFKRLVAAYQRLKASQWHGYSGYDPWFLDDLNNAKIASIALYTQLVPEFRALLAQQHGNLPAFYRRIRAIARMRPKARAAVMASLAKAAQPPTPAGVALAAARHGG